VGERFLKTHDRWVCEFERHFSFEFDYHRLWSPLWDPHTMLRLINTNTRF